MNKNRILSFGIFMLLTLALTACGLGQNTNIITASGTIDADTTRIASELAGKVASESAQKGDVVAAGDVLFQLDDALLQAKYEQAKAQVQQAEAALALAQQSLANAQVQYQLVLSANQQLSAQPEAQSWLISEGDNINLPNWYFEKSETISAAQAEVDSAQTALDEEVASMQTVLKDASNKDFIEAEVRLNNAQAAFTNADTTLQQANDSVGQEKETLVDAAQKIYDEAKSELDAAQKSYDGMLSGTAATDVLEARARVAAARARLENAQNALNALLTRDDALQVQSAKISVDTAQANVSQAEAMLANAQAVQHELEVTLAKTKVSAPVNGIVLSNPVNVGETVAAGVTVFEIGSLDEVTLTVYVTEDQIGKVKIGDKATVTVDSFSGETFTGEVVYISDEAEFTPRNIQTTESRSTTVYAVEIRLSNADHKLKPGMPADAEIVVGE